MSTVTSLTAARMLAIEASSVVNGAINGSGHLILTRHDGTTIDAGNALVAVPNEEVVAFLNPEGYTQATPANSYPVGVSLLYIDVAHAASKGWTSFTGKSGAIRTFKAVVGEESVQTWQLHGGPSSTPEMWFRSSNPTGWTVWKKVAIADEVASSISTLQATLLAKFEPLSTIPLETDDYSHYPSGLSMMGLQGADAPAPWNSIPPTTFGRIITANGGPYRTFQIMEDSGLYLHVRGFHEGDPSPWTPWRKIVQEHRLDPANYNQATPFENYPWGVSFLYLTNTQSSAGSWSFAPKYGFVVTNHYNDDFGLQTYYKHDSGSSGRTETWIRTSNNLSGWTPWRVVADDYLPTNWINASLTNSWVNYGTIYANISYRKEHGNIVRLRGLMKNGTVALGTAAFTLPAGYRPEFEQLFSVMTSSGAGRVDITTGGVLSVGSGGNGFVSLDAITFVAV